MAVAKKKRKAFVDQAHCVACGCCVKACPLGAIQIMQGITAQVNMDKCVGWASVHRGVSGKCNRDSGGRGMKSIGMIICGLHL
ncbi:MAG: ATP-binding protein [Enterocloster sp.]